MKKHSKKALVLFLSVIMIFTNVMLAYGRESELIATYSIGLSPQSNGGLLVSAALTTGVYVDTLQIEYLELYEQTSYGWSFVTSQSQTAYNASACVLSYSYQGNIGTTYMAKAKYRAVKGSTIEERGPVNSSTTTSRQ